MKVAMRACVAAVLTGVFASVASGQVPQLINYQGRLINGTNLVSGSVGLSLRLFNAPSGGTAQYEDSNSVVVVDGLYSTFIGDNTTGGTLTNALANAAVYVEVAVNGTALAPRERLASVAYALVAQQGGGGFVLKSGDTMTGALTNQQDITAAHFRNSHNTWVGDQASAIGGEFNSAGGTAATVSGGKSNEVNGYFGSIGGGIGNTAGRYGTIAGGAANTADGLFATIAGGQLNLAPGDYTMVGGGFSNRALYDVSTVGGGDVNSAGAAGSTIAGGRTNTIGTGSWNGVIGGGAGNLIETMCSGSVIGGGVRNVILPHSTNCVIAGGIENIAGRPFHGEDLWSTWTVGAAILGGCSNRASAPYSVVCGGINNCAADWLTVVGGGGNNVASNDHAFIGGGANNRALGRFSVIAGGGGYYSFDSWGHLALAEYSTIGGGYSNVVSGEGATIPGGGFNLAAGANSFAAGYRAKAQHDGSFVWGDNTSADIASTGTNQFLIRAGGGVGIGTASPGAALQVESTVQHSERIRLSGAEFFAGNTSSDGPTLLLGVNRPGNRQLWIADSANLAVNANNAVLRMIVLGTAAQIDAYATDGTTPRNLHLGLSMVLNTNGNVGIGTATPTNKLDVAGNVTAYGYYTASDRTLKENFSTVDANALLEKIAALPVTQWNFKNEPGVQHIGPMAQDFRAAFGLGQNDTTIATVDESGVALAAIKALNDKLNRENTELKARLERLEALLQTK